MLLITGSLCVESTSPVVHYSDVIMGAMTSQITSLAIVYSTVYSRRRSKKTSKIRVTGLCAGNSPVTDEFPAQMASNPENASIWWRHHVLHAMNQWCRQRVSHRHDDITCCCCCIPVSGLHGISIIGDICMECEPSATLVHVGLKSPIVVKWRPKLENNYHTRLVSGGNCISHTGTRFTSVFNFNPSMGK